MAMTVDEIKSQIDILQRSLSEAPEFEIDGAIKVKMTVKQKLDAIQALEGLLADLEGISNSPTSKFLNEGYE